MVPVVGAIGHLVQRHAQQGFALQAHDEIAAGGGLASGGQIGEVGAVLPRGGVGVAHVVDHHGVDALELVAAAGVFVHRQQILLHIVRQGDAGGDVAFLLLAAGDVRTAFAVGRAAAVSAAYAAAGDKPTQKQHQRHSGQQDAPPRVPPGRTVLGCGPMGRGCLTARGVRWGLLRGGKIFCVHGRSPCLRGFYVCEYITRKGLVLSQRWGFCDTLFVAPSDEGTVTEGDWGRDLR